MYILNNQYGNKSFYCWEGDVLILRPGPKPSVPPFVQWQDVIFGYYEDKVRKSHWHVGVKRNDEISGRSSFYYQVMSVDLANIILDAFILNPIFSKTEKSALKTIKDVINAKQAINSVADVKF